MNVAFLRRYVLQLSVLVVVVVGIVLTTPGFRGTSAGFATLEGFALVGLVALGISVTMIAGELDLSAGSMVVLSAVATIQLEGLGLLGSVLVATVVGGLFGAAQGRLIALLGINSLVFTIGSLIFLQGVAWTISGNRPVVLKDFTVSDPLLVHYEVFSLSSIVALIVFGGLGAFLALTRHGREIYAIGGARAEATAAGVPVARALTIAFAISSGCAALAGALAAMRAGSASPDDYSDILLGAIAAALIGGVGLKGGRGSVVNVAIGVVVVTVVSSGLFIRGERAYVTELATGGILVLVVALDFASQTLLRNRRVARAQTSPALTRQIA